MTDQNSSELPLVENLVDCVIWSLAYWNPPLLSSQLVSHLKYKENIKGYTWFIELKKHIMFFVSNMLRLVDVKV